jgi:hypothetical protein
MSLFKSRSNWPVLSPYHASKSFDMNGLQNVVIEPRYARNEPSAPYGEDRSPGEYGACQFHAVYFASSRWSHASSPARPLRFSLMVAFRSPLLWRNNSSVIANAKARTAWRRVQKKCASCPSMRTAGGPLLVTSAQQRLRYRTSRRCNHTATRRTAS